MIFSNAKTICVSINRSATEVYNYAADPAHLLNWAAGLASSTATPSGDHWIMSSPMGDIKVNFAPPNIYGVLDHDVTLPNGEVNHNPFRVVPNNTGSELMFTVYQRPGMTEQEFENDAAAIRKDLNKLKDILENK